jgi:hypothetical protein
MGKEEKRKGRVEKGKGREDNAQKEETQSIEFEKYFKFCL